MTNRAHKSRAPSLGSGVYHLAEVARYTELNPTRVRAWFKGYPSNRSLLQSDYRQVGSDFAVSFLDLVDVAVAGRLRSLGVSMPTVRAAYAALQEKLGVRHAFAHSDLYSDGRKIFHFAADELGDETLSDAVSHQQFFNVIRPLLKHIDYADTTALAERWRIVDGVVIDPAYSFGKPVIQGTSTTTFIIARSVRANRGRVDLVADLYDLEEDLVRTAVAFEGHYGSFAA